MKATYLTNIYYSYYELDNRMNESESGKDYQWAKKTRAPIVFTLAIDYITTLFSHRRNKATDGTLPTTSTFEVAMDRYYELFPQHTCCFKFPTCPIRQVPIIINCKAAHSSTLTGSYVGRSWSYHVLVVPNMLQEEQRQIPNPSWSMIGQIY